MLWCCCEQSNEQTINIGSIIGIRTVLHPYPGPPAPFDPLPIGQVLQNAANSATTYHWDDPAVAFYETSGAIIAAAGVTGSAITTATIDAPLGLFASGFGGYYPEGQFNFKVYGLPAAFNWGQNLGSIARSSLRGPIDWSITRPVGTPGDPGGVQTSPNVASVINAITGRDGSKVIGLLLEPFGTRDNQNNVSQLNAITYITRNYGAARLSIGS
jgi:hypothetical protein